ncbi:MAG: preprotein translocase subunit SecY [Nitrospinae bacterium]|nr:preprotein translocase subunit SecY [Nitrospinota bacterium]
MRESFQNIFKIPELRNRLLFTFALLTVFRIGTHVPTPGVDGSLLATFFEQQQANILSFFDMFTGGALSRFSVFALGIMPYISASIILELLTVVIPHLEQLKKEGDAGRKRITQYTRYGTVVLAMVQSLGISVGLEQFSVGGASVVPNPGWGFRLLTMTTLTAGTAFIMWLGEQITERGIGNGISLIIFAGIVAQMPSAIGSTATLASEGILSPMLVVALVAIMLAVVGIIVFFESGQRRVPIQYAKRVVGRRMYGGTSTHLPLKVNTSGVIPPIFASSVLLFPASILQFSQSQWLQSISGFLTPATWLYTLLTAGLIFFFCYFYTAIIFNPVEVADNFKKYGGFVPGIRPGRPTAEYIDRLLTRLTFVGAIYLSAIVLLPDYMRAYMNVPFFFGGTGLLIVVGVAMDTMAQIESHLVMRHYEGLMRKGRIKSRR